MFVWDSNGQGLARLVEEQRRALTAMANLQAAQQGTVASLDPLKVRRDPQGSFPPLTWDNVRPLQEHGLNDGERQGRPVPPKPRRVKWAGRPNVKETQVTVENGLPAAKKVRAP